jgi:ribose-phosphate pyrophosphokinase
MALPTPPLLRLFSRLDFVAPSRGDFALLMKEWDAEREGDSAPRSSAVMHAKSHGAFQSSFIFRMIDGERDYVLTGGRTAADALLGLTNPDGRLRHANNRRIAVRLRRLFDEARRRGIPFVAQFIMAEHGLEHAMVEVFIAPLSEDGQTIDSILSAASIRTFRDGAPALPPHKAIDHGFCLFALGSSREFGDRVARGLGVELTPYEERGFEDGEFKIRPLANVRNQDIYVVFSLNGEAGATSADKLCRLLFFIGALKDAGAGRITVVAPYLCYQRKDRQTKPRDPVATRYVAQLIEAMGTDRVITIDVHNIAAFQNAFRCDTEHLDAQAIFAHHFKRLIGEANVAVVSPDLGGEKRAEQFRERLERTLGQPVSKAFMDKRRSEGKIVGDIFAGDVSGRIAIILDDLISGGGTMARVARACRDHGATQVWCAATHGVFSPSAGSVLLEAPIDRIIITDTVSPSSLTNFEKFNERLTVLSATELVANAIKCCHEGGSIVKILEEGP